MSNKFDASELLHISEELNKSLLSNKFDYKSQLSIEIHTDFEEGLCNLYLNVDPSEDDDIFDFQLETIEKFKKDVKNKNYYENYNILIAFDF